MGSSKKTTTSNTSNTSNFTTTPQMPGFASSAIKDYLGAVGNYGQSDPYSFVTPASGLQSKAFDAAGNLPDGSGYDSVIAALKGNLNGTVPTLGKARSVLDNFNDYLDPTTQYLRDQSLATFDDDASRAAAATQGAAARNGAFGGSRYAIQQAQQEADTSLKRGLLDAGLLSDAWDKAAGLSQFDIGTQEQRDLANQAAKLQSRGLDLAAAGRLADVTGAQGANARANLEAILGAGNTQYAINDARTQAPLTQLSNYGGLLNPSLIGLITGQNVTGTETGEGKQVQKSSGGLLGKLASIAQIGSMFIPGAGPAISAGIGAAKNVANKIK